MQDTGTGYQVRYPVRSDNGYPAGFSTQNSNAFLNTKYTKKERKKVPSI
jgi:hypothetical protein